MDADGVPTFLAGELGALDAEGGAEGDAALRSLLSAVAPLLRADPDELVLRRAHTDAIGDRHLRFRQVERGIEVLGAEIVVHVRDGLVYAVNGSARSDLDAPAAPVVGVARAVAIALEHAAPILGAEPVGAPRLAYRNAGKQLELVHVVEIAGALEDGTPARDAVLVDAVGGGIAARIPLVHTAMDREIHDLGHGTVLPGPIARVEGGAPVADAAVNANYDRLGAVHGCYAALFGRDSFDGAGAKLVSSVHYGANFVNAFWDGTQMAFGDGDGVKSGNLGVAMDVVAHELTHAVTQHESNLVYAGEPGGLNEAMSDIFGNVCEWYEGGQVVDDGTWKVGEEVWTPGVEGDALRYLADPAQDGVSLDSYYDYDDTVDVHYSSGIANLAFYLLAQGGTHPRGKSTIVVPALGIDKAAQIFYRANTAIMIGTTDFAGTKVATEQAASQLGYTQGEIAAVAAAWEAVGVGVPMPPPVATALSSDVPVTGISATAGTKLYYTLDVPAGATSVAFSITGGTGDADLYVKFGAAPTSTSYDCRPYRVDSNETCTLSAQAGTYYVMLKSYTTYSGVTLVGSHASGGGSGGGSVLASGVPVTGVSGAAGSMQTWTLDVPSGQPNVTFTTGGGSGNLTLYVKRGAPPSPVDYDCRSQKPKTSETCSVHNPAAGTWYVSLHGVSDYAGVTLTGEI